MYLTGHSASHYEALCGQLISDRKKNQFKYVWTAVRAEINKEIRARVMDAFASEELSTDVPNLEDASHEETPEITGLTSFADLEGRPLDGSDVDSDDGASVSSNDGEDQVEGRRSCMGTWEVRLHGLRFVSGS